MADAALKNKVSDLLDKIKQGESINNLTALNEIRDTPFGQMIINTLSTYGTALLSTEGKTKSQEQKEAARKEAFDRCILFLQLEDLRDDLNKSIKDMHNMFEGFEKQRQAETAAAQSLVQTTTKSTNNIIHAATKIKELGYQIPEPLSKKIDDAKVCNAKMKTCSTNLGISDGEIRALEKEIIRKVEKGEPYEDLIEKLTTAVEEREGTKNELIKQGETYLSIGNKIIDEIDKHLEKPQLVEEERKLYTEFKQVMVDDMARVQKELDAFKNTASQALSPEEKIKKITKAVQNIYEIQEKLESFKNNPSLSTEDKQKIEQLKKDYTKNIEGLQEQQETLERLQELEEQTKKASDLINAAKSQYGDRESFIVAQYGGSWNFHAVLNGWDDYFSENPEEKHVTTENQEIVFHNEKGYYYYPENDLDAQPKTITDPLEVAKIQVQAYSGSPAKPFGNETRYGSNALDFITRSTAIDGYDSFADTLDSHQKNLPNIFEHFETARELTSPTSDTTPTPFKPIGLNK